MAGVLRQIVSKKKKRFQEAGYDLDLSYITDRIIAMGFPAEMVEGIYRNPMAEVIRFFEQLHPSHYHIYNLCSERQYDVGKFSGAVSSYPFDDHMPPPLDMIGKFCEDVYEYLSKDPENVVAIHCKAGKGRTGTLIACYLLYDMTCPSANAALNFFGNARTHDGQGVTIPSQRRYVHYFEAELAHGVLPDRVLVLEKIRMNTVPNFNRGGGCDPYISIQQNGLKIYYSKPLKAKGREVVDIDCNSTIVWRDVKIEFFNQQFKRKMFHFWFHTAFIRNNHLTLWRRDLDVAHKDRQNKHFASNFYVELFFRELPQSSVLPALPDPTIGVSRAPLAAANPDVIQSRSYRRPPRPNTPAPAGSGSPPSDSSPAATSAAGPLQQKSTSFREGSATAPDETSSIRYLTTGSCSGCGKDVGAHELSVVVRGKTFHVQCARCELCNKSMDGESLFVDEDGTVHCNSCKTAFFEFCHACGKQVESGPLNVIGGLTYHRACVSCVRCGRSLQWAGYRKLNNQPVCPGECPRPPNRDAQVVTSDYDPAKTKAHPLGSSAVGDRVYLYSDDDDDGGIDALAADYGNKYGSSPDVSGIPSLTTVLGGMDFGGNGTVKSDFSSSSSASIDRRIPFPVDPSPASSPSLPSSAIASAVRGPVPMLPSPGKPVEDSTSVSSAPPTPTPRECAMCGIDLVGRPAEDYVQKGSLFYCKLDYSILMVDQCEYCKEPIAPDDDDPSTYGINVGSRRFHAKCVFCTTCSIPCGVDRKFVELDGKAYCRTHGQKFPLCSKCNLPITDEQADTSAAYCGQTFHGGCHACTNCSKPLTDGQFQLKSNKPYCKTCYTLKFYCSECGLILSGHYLEALGRVYHQDCFVCHACHKPFPDRRFFEKEGKLYCAADFELLWNPQCAACLQPVANGQRFYTVGAQRYHVECLRCNGCSILLGDTEFFLKFDKPHCRACVSKS